MKKRTTETNRRADMLQVADELFPQKVYNAPAQVKDVVFGMIKQHRIPPQDAAALYDLLMRRMTKSANLESHMKLENALAMENQQINQSLEMSKNSIIKKAFAPYNEIQNMRVLQNELTVLAMTSPDDKFRILKHGGETIVQYLTQNGYITVNLQEALKQISKVANTLVDSEQASAGTYGKLLKEGRALLMILAGGIAPSTMKQNSWLKDLIMTYKDIELQPVEQLVQGADREQIESIMRQIENKEDFDSGGLNAVEKSTWNHMKAAWDGTKDGLFSVEERLEPRIKEKVPGFIKKTLLFLLTLSPKALATIKKDPKWEPDRRVIYKIPTAPVQRPPPNAPPLLGPVTRPKQVTPAPIMPKDPLDPDGYWQEQAEYRAYIGEPGYKRVPGKEAEYQKIRDERIKQYRQGIPISDAEKRKRYAEYENGKVTRGSIIRNEDEEKKFLQAYSEKRLAELQKQKQKNSSRPPSNSDTGGMAMGPSSVKRRLTQPAQDYELDNEIPELSAKEVANMDWSPWDNTSTQEALSSKVATDNLDYKLRNLTQDINRSRILQDNAEWRRYEEEEDYLTKMWERAAGIELDMEQMGMLKQKTGEDLFDVSKLNTFDNIDTLTLPNAETAEPADAFFPPLPLEVDNSGIGNAENDYTGQDEAGANWFFEHPSSGQYYEDDTINLLPFTQGEVEDDRQTIDFHRLDREMRDVQDMQDYEMKELDAEMDFRREETEKEAKPLVVDNVAPDIVNEYEDELSLLTKENLTYRNNMLDEELQARMDLDRIRGNMNAAEYFQYMKEYGAAVAPDPDIRLVQQNYQREREAFAEAAQAVQKAKANLKEEEFQREVSRQKELQQMEEQRQLLAMQIMQEQKESEEIMQTGTERELRESAKLLPMAESARLQDTVYKLEQDSEKRERRKQQMKKERAKDRETFNQAHSKLRKLETDLQQIDVPPPPPAQYSDHNKSIRQVKQATRKTKHRFDKMKDEIVPKEEEELAKENLKWLDTFSVVEEERRRISDQQKLMATMRAIEEEEERAAEAEIKREKAQKKEQEKAERHAEKLKQQVKQMEVEEKRKTEKRIKENEKQLTITKELERLKEENQKIQEAQDAYNKEQWLLMKDLEAETKRKDDNREAEKIKDLERQAKLEEKMHEKQSERTSDALDKIGRQISKWKKDPKDEYNMTWREEALKMGVKPKKFSFTPDDSLDTKVVKTRNREYGTLSQRRVDMMRNMGATVRYNKEEEDIDMLREAAVEGKHTKRFTPFVKAAKFIRGNYNSDRQQKK